MLYRDSRHPRIRREEVGNRHGRQRLPGPRLADDADDLARPSAERHAAHGDGTAREGHRQVLDGQHLSPVSALGVVMRRLRQRGNALRPALPSRARLTRRDLGQRLAQHREGHGSEDDRDRRADGDDRRDVDAADPLRQHAAPVVVGRLHGEAQEAEAGHGEERLAHGQRAGEEQRLGDVRKDVPREEPCPADPERPRCRHVVRPDHGRGQRLAEAGERRREREGDPDDGAAGADTDDRGHEDRDEQRGKRDREVDEARQHPPEPLSHERGQRSERDPDEGAEKGREEGERDREARRDENTLEDVATEVVRSERMGEARALIGGVQVEPRGLVRPEHRREHREEHDRRDAGDGEDSDRGTENVTPASQAGRRHLSRMVERGSITPRAMSTTKLITSTSVPKSSAIACTVG